MAAKSSKQPQSKDQEEKHICDGCGEEFRSQSELREHQEDCVAAGQRD